ncbi:MAG: PilC/PilY family type IV pilus protein [bacterium]
MFYKKNRQWMIVVCLAGVLLFVSASHAKMKPLKALEDMVVPPNIMFIVDTSGSMQWDIDGKALTWPDSDGHVYGAHKDSRLFIAKTVIEDVLNNCRGLANFGLMSFLQTHYRKTSEIKGYFPYYKVGSDPPLYEKMYFSKKELDKKIYTVDGKPNQPANSGKPEHRPVDVFEFNGVEYLLMGGDSSEYERKLGKKDKKEEGAKRINAWHTFCGKKCDFADPDTGKMYTWDYKGSNYKYLKQLETDDTIYYFTKFHGKEFVATGDEDLNNGCSGNVDPNDVFLYYHGMDGKNFKYSSVSGSWNDDVHPVGARDTYAVYRGGIVLVPISLSADKEVQGQKVDEIIQWMQPQDEGGLISIGATPTGSTLRNDTVVSGYYNDFKEYFLAEIDKKDILECRRNAVIFVTDGEPSPSEEAGYAKNAAADLYKNYGVKVYMVGFGADTAGSTTLNEIAIKGGTEHAYYATSQEALEEALLNIIFEAAAGDYATSSPTSGSGGMGRLIGNIGLLGSAEFPSWRGHLKAYDLSKDQILWDAGEMLNADHVEWNERKIYTSDSSNNLVPFFDSSGVPNTLKLLALGLGLSAAETLEIIEFIAGKTRSWRLFDVTNCTPVSVGPPYTPLYPEAMPGHDVFEKTYERRKTLVYCGSNDGMLHAFDILTGREEFAYVPPDLLPKVKELYLNLGQPVDPLAHIFGVAASPKAYDVLLEDDDKDTWRTVLVCGEGPGGYNYFALDVTHPSPGDHDYNASKPFKVLWHTRDKNLRNIYEPIVGESWSTPAIGQISYKIYDYKKSIFTAFLGSGYDDPTSADAEGITFMAIRFDEDDDDNGKLLFSQNLGAPYTIVHHGLMADAVCYEQYGFITDAYMVDTAGRVWHMDTLNRPYYWHMDQIYDASVWHPFFYSPAVLHIGEGAAECTTMVIASGTYDDPSINYEGCSFVSGLFLLHLDSSDQVVGSKKILFTDLIMDANTGEYFPARARVNASPVIIKNEYTSQYETIFLVYVPPVDVGCQHGKSYLVVYKLGAFGECGFSNSSQFLSIFAGDGKVTGVDIVGDPSAVLVGVSGLGGGEQSSLKAVPSTPSFVSGTVKELYWKEYINHY